MGRHWRSLSKTAHDSTCLWERSHWPRCRAGASQLWPVGQIWPSTVIVNNFVLEHSHVHSLVYCLWLLCTATAKPKIFTTYPFTEKKKIADLCCRGRGKRWWDQRQGDQLGACQEPVEWRQKEEVRAGDTEVVELSRLHVWWGRKKGCSDDSVFSHEWAGRGCMIHWGRKEICGQGKEILTLAFNMLSLRLLWNISVELWSKQQDKGALDGLETQI